MSRKLSGNALIRDMVYACQERIIAYHRKGFELEQGGDREGAQKWYRISQQQNALLQQYWQAGAMSAIHAANEEDALRSEVTA